jgi:hypothetical protein
MSQDVSRTLLGLQDAQSYKWCAAEPRRKEKDAHPGLFKSTSGFFTYHTNHQTVPQAEESDGVLFPFN